MNSKKHICTESFKNMHAEKKNQKSRVIKKRDLFKYNNMKMFFWKEKIY